MFFQDADKIDIKTDEGQKEVLYTCALRFDGYKYREEHDLNVIHVLNEYLRTHQWNISLHEKMACFYLIQRDRARRKCC